MNFVYPQLLLLLLMLPLVWRYLTPRRFCGESVLRVVLVALAIIILSRPYLSFPEPGTDLIMLVDRSSSCRAQTSTTARELEALWRKGHGVNDRLGVISFGQNAVVERSLDENAPAQGEQGILEFGSDISGALRLAGEVRTGSRRSAVLLLSDGNSTGSSPLDSTLLAGLEGMPVWYRNPTEVSGIDVATGNIVLPEEVAPRSAWVVRFSLFSNVEQDAEYELARGGEVLVSGKVRLQKGENTFFARDTASEPGVLEYKLSVKAAQDALAENNVSRAVLRVTGAPKVLLVTTAGDGGILARAMKASAIAYDVMRPEVFPLSPANLTAYKVVVLENSPLRDLPEGSAKMLAGAVENGLCALLVTGGPNSFGMGGYHRSAIDPLLPVSMELRHDKKRGVMALAIAMDRSGSMSMPAGGGRQKMDLADLSAAESIRLLSPLDQVSVIAVDSEAHVIVPLSRADKTDELVDVVMRIQSMGGGIYVYNALESAMQQLEESKLPTRHLILFADAADSEQQDGCLDLAREMAQKNITLSVIAMGTPTDSDAQFLMDLAKANLRSGVPPVPGTGEGEALFSNDIGNMPQLFTQEVIRVSRQGFITEAVQPRLLPAGSELGLPAGSVVPQILGYNFSSLRDGAECFMNLDDEFSTPVMAMRTKGKAVTAAVLFEIDGEFSGDFVRWPLAPKMLVALLRKLAGGVNYAQVRSYAQCQNGEAVVSVEFSPEMARKYRGKGLPVELIGPGGAKEEAELRWTGAYTAEARSPLITPGHYLPVIDLGDEGRLRAPGISLSYSAEFSPRADFSGERLLKELASATGGAEATTLEKIAESATRRSTGTVALQVPLLVLFMLLFLLELANRRFSLF